MRLSTVLIAFVSWRAAANCPNLTGQYAVCRSRSNVLIESTDLRVAQRSDSGIERYSISFLPDGSLQREAYELVADGVPVAEEWVSETGVRFRGVTTVHCEGERLKLSSVITADGEHWKTEHSVIKAGEDSSLVQESRGMVGQLAFTDQLICR